MDANDVQKSAERLVKWGSLNEHGRWHDQITMLEALNLASAYLARPEGRRADDGEQVTEEWLRANRFLPDGEGATGRFARRVWAAHEETDYGHHPAMHVLCSLVDKSCWLEAYSSGGQSLCLVEMPYTATRGHVRRLCEALGIPLPLPARPKGRRR